MHKAGRSTNPEKTCSTTKSWRRASRRSCKTGATSFDEPPSFCRWPVTSPSFVCRNSGKSKQSLRRYYGTHPRCGRPLWIDRIDRRGSKRDWYLAYHHPLHFGTMEPSLVPGRDSISIIDERSWTVCKVGGVYFFDESYPEGVTRESVERTKRNCSGVHRPANLKRHLRLPDPKKPGYVRVAIELDGFPPSWKSWSVSGGERSDTKRNAPKDARGFVETEVDPPMSSGGA